VVVAHGGLSAFNWEICTAVAKASAWVTCMVPEAEAAERAEAREARVELIAAAPNAGLDAMQRLLQRPPLPDDAARYWIIGHDRITAAAARFLHQNFYPAAARAQFVHTAPEQVEWHKPPDAGSTAAEKSEARERLELELARTAPRFDSPDAVPSEGFGLVATEAIAAGVAFAGLSAQRHCRAVA
jgi:hypothetical protein